MLDILYKLVIFPLVQMIEISYVAAYRIFHDQVIAIMGVSAVVSISTMPLYFIAEKWQETERAIQEKMKPKTAKIRAVFSGDERHMMLSALYRQHHYHPVYALRGSLGILVQVPCFIAAYSYLSRLGYLGGVPFLFIRDLGKPDALFSAGNLSFNVLPLLMTAVNIFSGMIYSRGKPLREKAQLYVMAGVFLLLLYGAPSALVLYWTMNNIFSLAKNILVKTKYTKQIIYFLLCSCALAVDIYFIPKGYSPKRFFVAVLVSLVFSLPLLVKPARRLMGLLRPHPDAALFRKETFVLSAAALFLLAGIVVPSALIASSVQEFSFVGSHTTPFPFAAAVLLQAAGIFLFWPLCVFFLAGKRARTVLTGIFSLFVIFALLNVFAFPGDWGFITNTFLFSNPDSFESKYKIIIVSVLVSLLAVIPVLYFLRSRNRFFFRAAQIIICLSLLVSGIFSLIRIGTGFASYEKMAASGGGISPEKVYRFSTTGKNVLVIMLDAGISAYVPSIFREKPELAEDFRGFTYFPNCVSFGPHTRIGAPPLFGGYEYMPRHIQKNRNYTLKKHNEALLVLPLLFSGRGYQVTVTDPPLANYSLRPDLSIFSLFPEMHAQNVIGNYTGEWLRNNSGVDVISIEHLVNTRLIRFSFLKIAPPAFRVFIYDRGDWLSERENTANRLAIDTLNNYTTLDFLPMLTSFTAEPVQTYTAVVNDLPHYPAFLGAPEYRPSSVPAPPPLSTGRKARLP
jgi:YidC/Oxa1 family membrane protein insertase